MPTPLTPPNFRGLRSERALTIYHRNLPHWRQDGATYFITFRLNDSIPAKQTRQIRRLRESWLLHQPPPNSETQLQELAKIVSSREEKFLDRGYGGCILADPGSQEIQVRALTHFDCEEEDARYELGAYVIMPNHVHAIVRPIQPKRHPLEKIIQSWKRHATREINKRNQNKGSIWEEESFDRIIRDENHLQKCLHYIGKNPSKAGLNHYQCPMWIRSHWRELGWHLDAQA
ncbi:MAG: putative transposase [Verrucomicrobiales bacterium]|jgi:putative transposase